MTNELKDSLREFTLQAMGIEPKEQMVEDYTNMVLLEKWRLQQLPIIHNSPKAHSEEEIQELKDEYFERNKEDERLMVKTQWPSFYGERCWRSFEQMCANLEVQEFELWKNKVKNLPTEAILKMLFSLDNVGGLANRNVVEFELSDEDIQRNLNEIQEGIHLAENYYSKESIFLSQLVLFKLLEAPEKDRKSIIEGVDQEIYKEEEKANLSYLADAHDRLNNA